MKLSYVLFQRPFGWICGKKIDHDWYVDSAPNATDNKLFHCARCDKSETYHGRHPPLRD